MTEGETGPEKDNTGWEPPSCYLHPSTPATALCVNCAKPVCRECDRRAAYRHYCPECLPASPAPAPYPYAYPYPIPPFGMQPPEPTDEREKRWWRADWGLAEVLVTLVIIFVLYNTLGVVLLLLNENGVFGGNPVFYSYLAYALFFCPLIAFSAWFIVRRHHRGWKELGFQWGRTGRTLLVSGAGGLAALAFSYGAFFLIALIFYLIAGRSPVSAESQHIRDLGGGSVALVILVTVVLAPIFEELFFRGLLYPALRRRVGYKVAIFIDGLIFGILHFQPLFMISLILVGIVLAYIYEKTDSLFAPILTHAFYNLVVIGITFLLG
jgi:uncharacterized protein